MAHTTSLLRTKETTEAQNNEGQRWSTVEAAVELILTQLSAISVALGGEAIATEYVSTITLATSSGSIPVGAASWSITAVSGTVTVSSQALAVGSTVGGGGYAGKTLKTAVAYTISSGSALVAYDTVG